VDVRAIGVHQVDRFYQPIPRIVGECDRPAIGRIGREPVNDVAIGIEMRNCLQTAAVGINPIDRTIDASS